MYTTYFTSFIMLLALQLINSQAKDIFFILNSKVYSATCPMKHSFRFHCCFDGFHNIFFSLRIFPTISLPNGVDFRSLEKYNDFLLLFSNAGYL